MSRHLGHKVRLQSAAPWLLRLLSPFVRDLRDFLPMVPHYVVPISFDASKLERLLGRQVVTPYVQGIAATLDWLLADARTGHGTVND